MLRGFLPERHKLFFIKNEINELQRKKRQRRGGEKRQAEKADDSQLDDSGQTEMIYFFIGTNYSRLPYSCSFELFKVSMVKE